MKKSVQGFTLIETVVAIGVFSIFFAAIAMIIQQVLQNVGYSRLRAVALSIGQERMELLRNLPYNSLGTQGGIPSGSLLQTDAVTINGTVFTITTNILYQDDPFDGSAPSDPIPADYKRARIQISWGGVYPSRQPVSLITNIVPKGIESNPGGGTLYIQVLNAQGQPVSNATVTVTNTVVNPAINLTTLTNAQGNVTIPAAPACVSCYNITATKTGYSTDRTYTTSEVANPVLPPLTVLAGQVSQASFAIDQVGSMSISSKGSQSQNYPPVANVLLTIHGSKIIGTNTSDLPVYKYSYSTTTGGGTVGIPNLEWDNYYVDLADSNYSLAGSNPNNPVTVIPASSNPVTLVVESRYNRSLLVIVKDQIGTLLPNAIASLSSTLAGFNEVKLTGATGSADVGQAFFNNLSSGVYTLVASLSGYQESTSSININTNQSTTIILGQ